MSKYDLLIKEIEEISNKYKEGKIDKPKYLDCVSQVCEYYNSGSEILSNKINSISM